MYDCIRGVMSFVGRGQCLRDLMRMWLVVRVGGVGVLGSGGLRVGECVLVVGVGGGEYSLSDARAS